ncbi:MAG: hypothetical protein U0176_08810 [Bacteroidia bacterium]
MSPVHEWVIDHIWLLVWLLPLLHSVVMGNLFGPMLQHHPQPNRWGHALGLRKVERWLLGYAELFLMPCLDSWWGLPDRP